MKILIVSYFSTDEITPRAFRAKEILETLKDAGHEVEVISRRKKYAVRYLLKNRKQNYKIFELIKTYFFLLLKRFLPGGQDLKWSLGELIRKVDSSKNYDLVISIGLPFSVHLVVVILRTFQRLSASKFIADYGDPYSSSNMHKFIFKRIVERWVLSKFDRVIIPTEIMGKAFVNLCNINKLVVSPQTVKLNNYQIDEFKEMTNVRFAFAGVFYESLREPNEFISYLASCDVDYEFHLFTDVSNEESMKLINRYKSTLGKRLFIHEQVDRVSCVYKLSSFDFLVNVENRGGVQVPSKLIDYSIAGRPILNVNDTLNSKVIDDFLKKNYAEQLIYDISIHSRQVLLNNLIGTLS